MLQSPEEKYLSLGPNIYGLVKTIYATYTYYTTDGQVYGGSYHSVKGIVSRDMQGLQIF